jgi:hypothetical protein
VKLHPAAARAAFREGADWIARPAATYCGPCGRRLEKAMGVVHVAGRRDVCVECFFRGKPGETR